MWTWTAIDADAKLVPSFMLGSRDARAARAFMHDLAGRLANRVQLTSDGLRVYLDAVPQAFGDNIDFATLVKMYGPEGREGSPEARYSPPKCNGTRRRRISGNPDAKHVSTSYAERLNLTSRMSMRRFTRLTNAFSKKAENLAHAVSLHFMHYNFCRKHQTLGCTPAQAAGCRSSVDNRRSARPTRLKLTHYPLSSTGNTLTVLAFQAGRPEVDKTAAFRLEPDLLLGVRIL
jgi:IS1 family transposase